MGVGVINKGLIWRRGQTKYSTGRTNVSSVPAISEFVSFCIMVFVFFDRWGACGWDGGVLRRLLRRAEHVLMHLVGGSRMPNDVRSGWQRAEGDLFYFPAGGISPEGYDTYLSILKNSAAGCPTLIPVALPRGPLTRVFADEVTPDKYFHQGLGLRRLTRLHAIVNNREPSNGGGDGGGRSHPRLTLFLQNIDPLCVRPKASSM